MVIGSPGNWAGRFGHGVTRSASGAGLAARSVRSLVSILPTSRSRARNILRICFLQVRRPILTLSSSKSNPNRAALICLKSPPRGPSTRNRVFPRERKSARRAPAQPLGNIGNRGIRSSPANSNGANKKTAARLRAALDRPICERGCRARLAHAVHRPAQARRWGTPRSPRHSHAYNFCRMGLVAGEGLRLYRRPRRRPGLAPIEAACAI